VTLPPQIHQLDVDVAPLRGREFPGDRADAGAIEIGDLVEVEQNTPSGLADERVQVLDELRDTVFHHKPALEVQNDHPADFALCDCHAHSRTVRHPDYRFQRP
jgi:hypothetical protein